MGIVFAHIPQVAGRVRGIFKDRTYATVTCDRNPHRAGESRKGARVQVVRACTGVAVTWLKAARASLGNNIFGFEDRLGAVTMTLTI